MSPRPWPHSDIRDPGVVVDDGAYQLDIEEIVEQPSSSGKLMYAGAFRTVDGPGPNGTPLYENYVVGSDDDPQAEDPETWKKSVGAQLLKACLSKAQVPIYDDLDESLLAAKGQQFIAIVVKETEEKEGPYKGRVRNRIRGYYTIGEKVPGPIAGGGRGPAAAARQAAAAAAPAARPAAPAPRPAAAPGRPVPRAAAPAPAAATPAPAARAPKQQMLLCNICQPPQQIPRNEFAAHVSGHEQE